MVENVITFESEGLLILLDRILSTVTYGTKFWVSRNWKPIQKMQKVLTCRHFLVLGSLNLYDFCLKILRCFDKVEKKFFFEKICTTLMQTTHMHYFTLKPPKYEEDLKDWLSMVPLRKIIVFINNEFVDESLWYTRIKKLQPSSPEHHHHHHENSQRHSMNTQQLSASTRRDR